MPIEPNLHLRGRRKLSSFNQQELARLLGHSSASSISRLESGEQTPDLRTAFTLEAIFGVPASRLFRAVFAECAKRVRDRAEVLDDSLALKPDALDLQRRRLELDAIIERLDQLGT